MNYFVRRQDNEYGRCDGMLHEIRERDSLYKVSRLYGVTVEDLMEKNPTVDVYNLTIGDKLMYTGQTYTLYYTERRYSGLASRTF